MFERIMLKQLNDHIWLLDDARESSGYLVVGKEKAVMIDTMNGKEPLMPVIRTVTDLPVAVINTHAHPDHIFGNPEFDTAMMHPADNAVAEFVLQKTGFAAEAEKNHIRFPSFTPILDGDTVDLGGLTLEAIHLPGHTPGGILLLLREDRVLFTGDSVNHHLWAQLEHTLPLAEILANMEKIRERVVSQADRILHGHATGFDDISLYDQLMNGILELVEQKAGEVTAGDKPYRWFGGVGLQHEFAPNSVICYTLNKLPDSAKP